jgi:hypothetical protein
MRVFRQISVWVVLASYLFANTLAASWHTHGAHECCKKSTVAEHGHHHAHGATGCHGHHHCHEQTHDHDKQPGTDGDQSPSPHHCVVCDFLALAPLAAPVAELLAAGEAIPTLVPASVELVAGATVQIHLARGPPTLS